MPSLSNIMIFNFIILVLSLGATTLLYRAFRFELFKFSLLFWCSTATQMFFMSLLEILQLDLRYEALIPFGIFMFLNNFIFLNIASRLLNVSFSSKAYLLLGITAIAIATILTSTNFHAVSLTATIGICLPTFYFLGQIYFRGEKDSLITSFFTLYALILVHYIDYSFLRLSPTLSEIGIFIHTALNVGMAILLPSILLNTLSKRLKNDHQAKQYILKKQSRKLESLVTQKNKELDDINQKLLDTAKHASRAELVTGILHNVGNVLNSINISIDVVGDITASSPLKKLPNVVDLIDSNLHSSPDFFVNDPKGSLIPNYLRELSKSFANDTSNLSHELKHLKNNVDHIKSIVEIQQSISKFSGVTEEMSLNELIDQAIQVNLAAIQQHEIKIIKDYKEDILILGDRLALLQVLINLVSNAKHALFFSEVKLITIRAELIENDQVKISISDTGMGITDKQMPHMFKYGYTTREEGHGFGLHSSLAATKELGGSLEVQSDGKDLGATFILIIPKDQIESQIQQAS